MQRPRQKHAPAAPNSFPLPASISLLPLIASVFTGSSVIGFVSHCTTLDRQFSARVRLDWRWVSRCCTSSLAELTGLVSGRNREGERERGREREIKLAATGPARFSALNIPASQCWRECAHHCAAFLPPHSRRVEKVELLIKCLAWCPGPSWTQE